MKANLLEWKFAIAALLICLSIFFLSHLLWSWMRTKYSHLPTGIFLERPLIAVAVLFVLSFYLEEQTGIFAAWYVASYLAVLFMYTYIIRRNLTRE